MRRDEQQTALGRTGELNVDVVEGPPAAGVIVFDDQRALLQTDLGKRDAVESALFKTVEPTDELRIMERLGNPHRHTTLRLLRVASGGRRQRLIIPRNSSVRVNLCRLHFI